MSGAKPVVYLPREDGLTHLNCCTHGRTPLGRSLSNFAHLPFTHPKYGTFASVEGFWYFLGTGCKHTVLKKLYGIKAKVTGRTFEQIPMEAFEDQIEEAIVMKIEQHPQLLNALLASSLPVAHYLVFGEGSKAKVVDKTAQSGFLINAVATIRSKYRRLRAHLGIAP